MKLFCVLLLLAVPVFSQEAGEKEKSRLELETKAVALVEQAISDSSVLKLPENRVFILAAAIDLLWKNDEKRAREIARTVADELQAMIQPVYDDEKTARLNFLPLQLNAMRRNFLQTVAHVDAEFALEMLAATRPAILDVRITANESDKNTLRTMREMERVLEQEIAFSLAETDAAKALRLSKQSISRGASSESLNLLFRLYRKNPELAAALGNSILDSLQTSDFEKDREALFTAQCFLNQFDEKQGVFGSTRACNCPNSKPLAIDPKKLNAVADKYFVFLNAQTEEQFARQFFAVLPVLTKLLPERAAALKQKQAIFAKTFPAAAQNETEQRLVSDDDTPPEKLIALAAKKPDGERLDLYSEAFYKAANTSKSALEKLRSALAEHAAGKDKTWIISEIDANIAGKTADEGNLAEAAEIARRIELKDKRIMILAFIARQYAEAGDRRNAVQILAEVSSLMNLKTPDPLPKRIGGYLVFASAFHAYAAVEPAQAFVLLESSFGELNENLTLFKSSDGERKLRDVIYRYSGELGSYGKTIAKLAASDFERTQRLADFAGSGEFSAVARLIIAQAILRGEIGFRNRIDFREKIVSSSWN